MVFVFIVLKYNARWVLYLTVIISIYAGIFTDDIGYTTYGLPSMTTIKHFPLFVIGAGLADMEAMKAYKPLDYLRDVSLPVSVIINIVLLFFFHFWGG